MSPGPAAPQPHGADAARPHLNRADAPRRAAPLRRALAWAAVLLALGGVFMAYQQPEFVAEMARQAWACL